METLLNHPLLLTLAYALLHSLWQVSLLVGMAAAGASFSSSARVKHRIYLAAMLASGVAFLLTLCYYLPASPATLLVQISELPSIGAHNSGMTDEVAGPTTPTALSVGAMLYLLGLLLLLLRATLELFGVAKIRRQSLAATGDLATLFNDLLERWQPALKTKVQLRLSAKVGSALTLGLFRPLIVLPIGMVNQLSAEEVEAILLHELAHVLRRDHWWNALQTGLRLLFFYHPLVYWLSRKIDQEREYACDDLVTGRIDRQLYAQSLLRVAEFSITHKNQFIMQAQGKTHFTHRIQRLFQSTNPVSPISRPQRWWLPLLLLPLLFTAVLSAQRQAADSSEKTEVATESQTTVFYLDGKRYADLDLLETDLQPGATMQSCEDGDPELAKINAAEGTNYTRIMRFFNPDNINAVPDQKTSTSTSKEVTEQVVEQKAVGQNELSVTYITGEALEKEDERMVMAKEKKLKLATFIDDTPVYYADDDGESDISIEGEGAYLYDNNAPETIALNKETGKKYDGIVRMRTTKDTFPPKENAAKALSFSDSVLILINDQPYYEKDILNRIDPKAIKEIHVIKEPALLEPYGKSYTGLIKVSLKPGFSVEDMPLPLASPQELTPGLEEILGPGYNYENTYIEVDGKSQTFFKQGQRQPANIKGMEVIKDPKQLSAAGVDPKYRGAIFITTSGAAEKADEKTHQEIKAEKEKLKAEKEKLKLEKEKLKLEKEKFKAEQKKAAMERSKGAGDGGGL